jgi:hypothetical protein
LVKLSNKETQAATKLMAKEFSKDVGPPGKRKIRAENVRKSIQIEKLAEVTGIVNEEATVGESPNSGT